MFIVLLSSFLILELSDMVFLLGFLFFEKKLDMVGN